MVRQKQPPKRCWGKYVTERQCAERPDSLDCQWTGTTCKKHQRNQKKGLASNTRKPGVQNPKRTQQTPKKRIVSKHAAATKDGGAAEAKRVRQHWFRQIKLRGRVGWLRDILKIYNYPFLKRAERFVVSQLESEQGTYDDKLQPPVVMVSKAVKQRFGVETIRAHMTLRHPVHINGPDYAGIDRKNMTEYLGYGEEAPNLVIQDPQLRYGIVGQALVQHPEDPAAVHPPYKSVFVCHTWGVNLESYTTTDALEVLRGGSFAIQTYLALLQQVMDIIEASARYVHQTTNKMVVMRTVRLGMGAWSNAIPPFVKPDIVRKYDEMLLDMQRRNKMWLAIHLVDFPNHRVLAALSPDQQGFADVVSNNHDPFWGPDDDVMRKNVEQEKFAVMLVNAWDDRSMIGNGGSHDDTLDGWMVAGSGGTRNEWGRPLGSNAINTSYLHNPVFYPEPPLVIF